MRCIKQTSDASFSSKVSHNMASNIIRTVLMALVGLLMVPYYIGEFGLATYAMLPLATTITNYFLIISDSLSNAFSRYTVMAVQNNDEEGTNRVFSTSVLGMARCMAIMLLFSMAVSYAAPYVFQVGESSRDDVQVMFFLIMLASMIISFSASLGSVYMAYNKLYITYWSRSVQTVSQVVLVVALFLIAGPSLQLVGVSFLVSAVVMLAMMVVPLKRVCPTLRFSRRLYDGELLKKMGGLGMWAIVSEIGNLLFIQASLIVVNLILGSHAQGTFSIAANVIMMIHTACTAISASAVPLIYRHHAHKDTDSLVSTLLLFSKFVGVTMAFPVAFIIIFMPQIIGIWLGTGYDDLFPLLYMMVPIEVTVCAVSAYMNVPVTYMRMRPVALATLIAGIFNIAAAVAILLFTDVGIIGVCAVWAVSMLLLKVGFFPAYCAHLTRVRILEFLKPVVFSNVVFAALLLIGYAFTQAVVLPTTWLAVLSAFFIAATVFFLVSLRCMYNREERSMILSFLPSFVQKVLRHRGSPAPSFNTHYA